MNPLTPWLVALSLLIILIAAVFVAKTLINVRNQQIDELLAENDRQKKNILYLYDHAEEISKIRETKEKTDDEIRNSKSDDEVLAIINAIVATNNRLRK